MDNDSVIDTKPEFARVTSVLADRMACGGRCGG
jgi:hypothetical protein